MYTYNMSDTAYIVFTNKGIRRLTKKPGNLKKGEHVIKIKMSVDRKYFEHNVPVTTIELNENHRTEVKASIELAPLDIPSHTK